MILEQWVFFERNLNHKLNCEKIWNYEEGIVIELNCESDMSKNMEEK